MSATQRSGSINPNEMTQMTALSPFCAVTFSRFVHARVFRGYGAKLNYPAECKKADLALHRSAFWSGTVKVRTMRSLDQKNQMTGSGA